MESLTYQCSRAVHACCSGIGVVHPRRQWEAPEQAIRFHAAACVCVEIRFGCSIVRSDEDNV